MFCGAYTAMVTPFSNGQVDRDQLVANVRFQVENGIDGLVPSGTTGESPTLSHEEQRWVNEWVVDAADGKVKVIAGTGSNSTSEALKLTEHARNIGADGALMVNPYYNKPSQEGLYRHFMTIADKVDLPIVLYNIPGRTSIEMTPQTVGRLSTHPNVVGVKEATGSMDTTSLIAQLCDLDQFAIISGDDSLTLPLMSLGAKGVISVLSNLIPDRIKAITTAALASDFESARSIHYELLDLFKVMFIETNPVPIKAAMAIAGMDSGELRLPLCELEATNRMKLESVLAAHNIVVARRGGEDELAGALNPG